LYGDIAVREEDGNLVVELGPQPFLLHLEHWDRDVFTYALPPSGEVLLGRLGMQFSIGPFDQATSVQMGLPSVGPDGTAVFNRTEPVG
jgi:hypothetical protein